MATKTYRSFYLQEGMDLALRKMSEKQGMSVSRLVRTALNTYLEQGDGRAGTAEAKNPLAPSNHGAAQDGNNPLTDDSRTELS